MAPIEMAKQLNKAPLKRLVLKDQVSDLIKNAILSGKLEAGDRIVEMKLAEDLGVGTTAVREALFELEAQGFVTRLTNKGTFVTQLSKEDVAQILRVRHELEGLAVELLEKRATEDNVASLLRIVEEMRQAAQSNDLQEFYRADLEFHRTIWSLSGNRHLAKALDITVVPLFAFFIIKNPSDSVDQLLESVNWHGRVVEAIAKKENARKCMEAALKFFNEQENWMLFDAGSQKRSHPS
ncbi:MAG TPA: GntR family transcriptional regulator [Bryobacteraceae bacterium]|nr:GntR family transcriptional regulator [Bryobacteraceae bacterium]